MEPVVVMEVHHDGYRLSEHYADPHYHIPNLPSGKGEGRQHPKGDLRGREGKGRDGIHYKCGSHR